MSMQDVFSIAVVIFTVSNIGAMGLGSNLREALKDLRSIRVIGLILLWGWVVGPALAWFINGLKASGSSTVKTLSLWLLIALVSGGASAAGFALLADVPETWMAFVQTFAAGAILTMLANSMIPEAYEYGRKLAGPDDFSTG